VQNYFSSGGMKIKFSQADSAVIRVKGLGIKLWIYARLGVF
jgi:hypothetical protein